MNKTLRWILILCFLWISLGWSGPAVRAAESGSCGENLVWKYNEQTQMLTIRGKGAMDDFEWETPWQDYSGYHLVIEKGVTSIGKNAFINANILDVSLPAGLKTIGANAFYGCSGLETVSLPDSLKTLGDGAFAYSVDLKSITVPDGVTSFGEQIFYECQALTEAVLPSKLTRIGERMFYGCLSLQTITVPKNVTEIGEHAFKGCESLTAISMPAGLLSIDTGAFENCTSLQTVRLPDKVSSIAMSAFQGCTGLTSVSIPASVTEIGICAFEGCLDLEKILVDKGSQSFASLDGVLYNKAISCVLRCPQKKSSYQFPDTVDCMENYAFSDCRYLKKLVLPDKMKFVSFAAFQGCQGLKSIQLPKDLRMIDCYAFSGCEGLTSLNIPSLKQGLGRNVFENCSALTSLAIPEGEAALSEEEFKGCRSLKKLTLPSTLTEITVSSFLYDTALTDIYFMGTKQQWKQITFVPVPEEDYSFYSYPRPGEEGYVDPQSLNIHCLKASAPVLKNTDKGVQVSWDRSDSAGTCIIYRKIGSGKWKKLAKVTSGGTYLDTLAVKQGKACKYRIRVTYGKAVGPYTKAVTVYRLATPAVTSVKKKGAGSLTVQWKKQSKVTGYQIRYQTGKSKKTVTVQGASKTKSVLSGLTKGYNETWDTLHSRKKRLAV